MRFGIDLGTTRTVVARVDRGNYPVVSLTDGDGDAHEYYPSVVALAGGGLVYGFEAEAAGRAGAPVVRSFKRILGDPATTQSTTVDVGGRDVPILDLLTGFLTSLRACMHTALAEADLDETEPMSDGGASPAADGEGDLVVASVPAHAHTAQRYLTIEAFRRAGFGVLALVNEPSAAGFEYTHRQPRTLSARRTQVLVYDLGGGTFDASLVRADGGAHDVLGSVGVNRLGGDDVDEVLAEVALAAAGGREQIRRSQWRQLVEDCRDAKERLTPQSRRIVLEVGEVPVIVAVDDFYAAAQPLVERSIEAMESLVGRLDQEHATASLAEVAGLYLVGGGSGLPLVPRMLRERFGRRVHRSPYPAAATAIGLAIAADPDSGYTLTDRLSRAFGVFRERSGGAALGFDELIAGDTTLPTSGSTVVATRRYRAAHDVGWFRYVEYREVDGAGEPRGEIVPFAEVVFPFDPALRDLGEAELAAHPVSRRELDPEVGPEIEEVYAIDADGIVTVTITEIGSGFTRSYGLG